MSDRLSTLERNYFTSKVGGAVPSESINNIKRRYWLGLFGGDRNTGMGDLENDWLRKIITDNSGTVASSYSSDLYVEAVASLGGTPSKFINENKRQVYILDL
jgi:hypothetical protein